MTRIQNIIASTFATMLIGGLMIAPASAAVQRHTSNDLTAITHSGAAPSGAVKIGHTTDEFNRNDLSAVTHRGVTAGLKSQLTEDPDLTSRRYAIPVATKLD